MLADERLQQIIKNKDVENSMYGEGWAICDGALVIYDVEDPPAWFRFERDEDGNSVEVADARS